MKAISWAHPVQYNSKNDSPQTIARFKKKKLAVLRDVNICYLNIFRLRRGKSILASIRSLGCLRCTEAQACEYQISSVY